MRSLRFGAGVFVCAVAFASPESYVFEVASVKPSGPIPPGTYLGPAHGGLGTDDPVRITWDFARMKDLLMTAFDAKAYQVAGPAWLDTERYNVAVKVPPGTTREQIGAMWRNLLKDRFGLKAHHDARDFQVEELVLAKGGSKLKETTDGPVPYGPPKFENGQLLGPGLVSVIKPNPAGPRIHMFARAEPLSKLTATLSGQLDHPVLDKTGLAGLYNFDLEFTGRFPGVPLPAPSGNTNDNPDDIPIDLRAALIQQLGLTLVANRAKIDVVVVDQVEKVPTEN